MATQVAPKVDILRKEIQEKYTEVASNPELTFHFHHGLPLAKILEYPEQLLDGLPDEAVESFAGVGNPFSVGEIATGETVLDIGSGCGFDCMIAAKLVGPAGKVIGVDMTDAMLQRSRKTAKNLGLTQLEFKKGYAEELPAPDGSVDVVISNGVINLTPDKYAVFNEVFRVLKPGGRLYLADIVVYKQVPDEAKKNVDLWTA
ncbi:MAG: methyltransferase domain-containing protein [Chloroflexi bacterium]|nr:methyltransferase domain-containing protein [Chloroflexota bacterium]MCI0789602.1 methyltransferase domain-containing protein [Chloroflexota bacterium]MCI0802072.1 methyltransferase domain-containing protein [Chloroflexota bacterium]MCI0829457.1 methyltransferase domain-containing protein [Chloroflexota bacterium]MCI0847534.1 methyltransferase domain-containing protein [Chloroflexota bacterium]